MRNIFSRVTSGSVSNIDGLLRANGTANLFLLNPNGILLGPNASLNVGGSFVATTATAIGFPNGEKFSSDATQPLPSQLLTVNPNAFFFNQLTPKPIINQSIANGTGLQVSPRQNLMLVGGPVQLENGRLTSPGSYVKLGAVGGVGTVGLSTTGEDWRLDMLEGVPRADISLRNGGHIVPGSPALSRNINGIIVIGDSGSIRILGHNIDLLGSSLWVEIPSSSRLPDARTGGIELNATGSIAISDSVIANRLFGRGSMGNIDLMAGDRITFADNSRLYNTVDAEGIGNTGGLSITTGSLSLTEGTQLISGTRGLGNTGDTSINARDTISLDSYRDNGFGTGIFNITDTIGVGNAGDINITTGSLSLSNGAQLQSYTKGRGNAGSVNIHARDTVSLDGVSSSTPLTDNGDGVLASAILTEVFPDAVGQGGEVNIAAGSLFLTNGGTVNTSNIGGIGNSGRVIIQARDSVQIRGIAPTVTDNRSGVFTLTKQESVGNGGDVIITASSLSVSD